MLARLLLLVDSHAALEAAGSQFNDDDAICHAWLMLAEGALAEAEGDEAAARKWYDDGVAALEALSLVVDVADARRHFAGALSRFGAPDEARDQLEGALAAFVRMGADATVVDVERELAALV